MGLYKEEEEERRRRKERRGEERRGRKKRRRRALFWMLIITLISLVFGTLIGIMDVYIAKLAEVNVDSYRPTDTERRIYELEKAKDELEKEILVHKK